MTERELARVCLVRAAEEGDPEGRFLRFSERERATSGAARDAEQSDGGLDVFLSQRSAVLATRLEDISAAFGTALRIATARPPGLLVVLAAFAAGFAVDALGTERRINLLAFPLLGLLLWNACVYLFLTLAPLLRRPGPPRVSWLLRFALSPERRWLRTPDAAGHAWTAATLRRFGELWWARTHALWQARSRALLHAGAGAFAAGVVASMYAGGFAFEYRASWESSFLDARGTHRILSSLLGPAAAVLGTEVPGPERIAALRTPESGPAAPWIHLWALTAVGAVIAPRTALALAATASTHRAAAALTPERESDWAQRLTAGSRGDGRRVDVVFYSHSPRPAAADALREALLEVFGNRIALRIRPKIGYGDALPADGDPPDALVVVLPLAQSPESEVHGEFLVHCRETLAPSGQLLVLFDEAPYRERAGEERADERRRSWERVLREHALHGAALPDDAPAGDLSALRAAIETRAA